MGRVSDGDSGWMRLWEDQGERERGGLQRRELWSACGRAWSIWRALHSLIQYGPDQATHSSC